MKQKLFVVATLIILQASTSINAQQLNAPQRSYQQARRVLDHAIEAHGGLEALRAIKDFTLKEKGKIYARSGAIYAAIYNISRVHLYASAIRSADVG